MVVIWDIIKKTALFGWEEIIYLVAYNIVTLVALLVGPTLLMTGINIGSALLMLAGSVAMFAIPPALFGLFWLTYQISLGNAVKFGTFWVGAKQHKKTAYFWGGINLLVIITLVSNILFYQAMTVTWAVFVGQFFYGLLVVWLILQLMVLALFPHMVEPNVRLALKNAMALIAVNPFAVIGMAAIVIGEIVLGGNFPVILGLFSVSLAALVASVTVAELIAISRGEK